MSEVNNSALLNNILTYARRGSGGAAITAEQYILAVMDTVSCAAGFSVDTESAIALGRLLGIYLPIGKRGEQAVRAMIAARAAKSAGPAEAQYLEQRMENARRFAAAEGKTELLPTAVLISIFREPNAFLKDVLSGGDGSTVPAAGAGSVPSPAPGGKFDPLSKEDLGALGFTTGAAPAPAPAPEPAETAPPPDPKTALTQLTEKTKALADRLKAVVFGQDKAVSVFASGYFQGELLSLTDKKRVRPRATFLFAGPPGVGKTFLAETAAEVLGLPFMRFDMSEYSDKEANIEFCGSDRVYKDSKPGNVTSFVNANPRCVLLFDEIEKAHINVIHLFLQMLDAGRLRDNHTDREVPFTDAVIIVTTNAGRRLYEEAESGDFSGISRKVILKALGDDVNPQTGEPFFPAALCSRFAAGNVVMLNRISAHNLYTIGRRELTRHAENFEKEIGVKIEIDPLVYTSLLFAEGGAADARTVRSRAETFFNDELYEMLRLLASEGSPTGIADLEKLRICVKLPENDPEITALYYPAPTENTVLVIGDAQTCAHCVGACPDVRFVSARTKEEAEGLLKKEPIGFALVDLGFGRIGQEDYLNAEDLPSVARDLLRFIRERFENTPVYLLSTDAIRLTPEQELSFLRQGVRGFLPQDAQLAAEVRQVCESLHQQAAMRSLAKTNRVVQYETAQRVVGGRVAEIVLFDFRLRTAVSAEDSKNILSSVSKPDVCFADVIGAEDAKKELQYFVQYLKNPKKYMGLGVHAPKGVLLYGPPGTGKTMLAKAMANESDVTFICAEGNQFLKKYIGEGPEKVHELFRTARKYAPAILFVDEIDAIARERGGSESASVGVDDVLTAFLAEMDGFKNNAASPVFVLAATNFSVEERGPGRGLDPAMLRRFDRRIYVDLPTKEERIRFLKQRLAKSPIFRVSEAAVANIALRSTGMSLAQLDSVAEFALRSAIRTEAACVDDAAFEEAFETFSGGEEKKWDPDAILRTARHESGHTLLCWLSGEKPSYVTIVSRGDHGGYMQHGDRENKAIYTKEELLANIRVSLGGRAAELVYYGEEDGLSTGPSADLENATRTARAILCRYGMDGDFGMATADPAAAGLAPEVQAAVNRILQAELQNAVALIRANMDKMERLVEALMQRDRLTEEEIDAILSL